MVLYGATPWTVAAVVLALIVVFRRPAAASGLLPLVMTGMGIWGLRVAAATPGASPRWFSRSISWVVNMGQPGVEPSVYTAYIAPTGRIVRTQETLRGALYHGWLRNHLLRMTPGRFTKLSHLAGGVSLRGYVQPGAVYSGPAFSRAHLLLPVSLILLAAGLWLAPRGLSGLRVHLAKLAPYLRQRWRENYWGVFLVPVAAIGLTVFGVHVWTIMAVAAALATSILWPYVAADLIPAALAGFAVVGFIVAASWQSLPRGSHGPTVLYGAVLVTSQASAVLAGAEASAFLALAAWLVPRTIGAHARALGTPQPDLELAGRVRRLTETREHAIDSANSELLRIERDLHDGAQARLVALGMNLRSVERLLPADPQAALALVGEARETSLRALTELRHLIRGIYPPVLADRGLAHAVRALTLDTPVQTELHIDLPGRLAPPVESACYFAVAEALANAVKHASARCVHIRIEHAAGLLRIEVFDDGIGGADLAAGTGLRGVERRLGTFDGILAVSSPAGGPTMIAMEVPCALSSPKTCSC
jgi:signal transduction histidine kinase